MKAILLLAFASLCCPETSLAQANFAFANQGSTEPILIRYDGVNVVPIGTNIHAVQAGAGPGQVKIELWVGTNGTTVAFDFTGRPISGMVLAGSTTNAGSSLPPAQGFFNGGNPFVLPAPFDGSFEIQFSYWATTASGFWGYSRLATGYSPAVGTTPIRPSFGPGNDQVVGFTLMIPEPSILSLGGLGFAGLLISWRRNRLS